MQLEKEIQSNPLNGSPDNVSIRLLVHTFASPILYCSLSNLLSDNGSICLLVQILTDKSEEPLSGFDCTGTGVVEESRAGKKPE